MMISCKSPSAERIQLSTLCKSFSILVLGMFIYLLLVPSFPSQFQIISSFSSLTNNSPTTLNDIVFGILGSEKAWHHRKSYIESWWRPKQCRGFLYLDTAPTGELLPWSEASPPYRVYENITEFWRNDNRPPKPAMMRMVHGILEVVKEVEREGFRWLVMGDDDSIFFIDNMVNVLREYDHTKYYYLGGHSEFIESNFGFSFNEGFGGAGVILSYPLAKALAQDMTNCLRRYAKLKLYYYDHVTMMCIADIGVNLSPQKGLHQIDLRGDISGFLSSHPKYPLMSLHHMGMVAPIFPSLMDRFKSLDHLMEAAKADQSRMLQQTICYDRQKKWTFSISWGYSAHLYKKIFPRSFLQNPIETFEPWTYKHTDSANYLLNTRLPSKEQSKNPLVFFFHEVRKTSTGILTTYTRTLPGRNSADAISVIQVHSPATKRLQMDRCECCYVLSVERSRVHLSFRECMSNEIIA